ncbi:hypothetical protein [Cytobacillus sp. NCCP-133]|uniref:hypothetical protein n=1 Tax=Cytobacillus sp. NCCP-133 TaxID=766848 RepID=UPI00222FC452|nr:hypothetical protein [Cytobacillus sp. NCCP-133]GLB58897.1 hypothetical protein NCCP133_10300 [Cytobacillus sp. NCCP-133]
MFNGEYQNRNEDKEEIDPFAHFLFGSNANRKRQFEEDLQEENINGGDYESSTRHQSDWLFGGRDRESIRNDDWLFGGRSSDFYEKEEMLFGRSKDSHGDDNSLNSKVNSILNNVNLEELMNNIDTLMSSANQLKPLLKKASPFLEQFLKK